jgi:hypothetical protein
MCWKYTDTPRLNQEGCKIQNPHVDCETLLISTKLLDPCRDWVLNIYDFVRAQYLTIFLFKHFALCGTITGLKWLSTELSQKSIRWPWEPNDPGLGCGSSACLPNMRPVPGHPVTNSPCVSRELFGSREVWDSLPRPRFEPTVRIDICESAVLHHFAI